MPSPFQAAGATVDQSKSAPLHTNRFFTGLWTQRSPLRDAATPFLYEKFYSASRYDSLIGGLNTEITTRLTLARRPGLSPYASPAFTYGRISSFRAYVNQAEVIYVLADTADAVPGHAAVGAQFVPNRPYGGAIALQSGGRFQWLTTKLAGSRRTFFQPVGNTLYLCDGAQCLKWVLSRFAWQPVVVVEAGTFLVDPNNNIQFSADGGWTGATQPAWSYPVVIPAPAVAQTTNGPSGNASQHASVIPAAPTIDGSVTWVYKGPAVQNWGIAAPILPPSVALVSPAAGDVGWVGSTYFRTQPYSLDTATNTAQQLIQGGVTAFNTPAFNATPGGTTEDGTAVWRSLGSAAWQPNAGEAVDNIVAVVDSFGYNLLYQAQLAGVTGPAQPPWSNVTGAIVQDGTVVWQNIGYSTTSDPSVRGINNAVSSQIVDPAGGTQVCIQSGESQSSAPAFAEVVGKTTGEGLALLWRCTAPPPSATAAWTYAYAFRNSVTGHVSTASPLSGAIVPSLGSVALLTGMGSSDPQVDTIRLYRTAQGQSLLLFLADTPNVQGQSWMYYDNNPDAALNILIEAQIADTSDPPPPTIAAPVYYLDRIWAFNGNVLLYSGGPDTLSGNGNEAWPPANSFTYPSRGVRLWPTNVGLIVFTQSDVYVVQGNGTAASPFFSTNFQEGVGLLNYDSFAVNGSTAYLMTAASRLVAFDPGAGETEVGFPIGDLLSSYTQAGSYLVYHEGSSADTALYAGDGEVGWYRLSTISAPEQGQVWSPQAAPAGGIGYMQSVEIAPGVKKLFAAPVGAGSLLVRDDAVSADNGVPFAASATIGSIVLAQPGQIAGVEFLTVDSTIAGSRATLGLLFGEIAGTFTNLIPTRQDPTLLPPSTTIRGDRYYMPQVGRSAWCRHMQIRVSWPAEAQPNEMLAYTLFGEIKQERPEG